ncbi:MAG: 23S rRNA (adenine(2030)-N(6))-methyltransferase RlmJ [Oceanospirillaceae bacterium]|nr:23S rRNA (adenine(2030)-N(6))-methyltransferase RlmJ [Oceanospirillaceae bacterium]
MLSYQHSYHAGNFADVHKHLCLSLILDSLNKKAKPWSYFETHAGTARYDLEGEQAQKTAEYLSGIGRIYDLKLPPLFYSYLNVVKGMNTKGSSLAYYPGSPLIASEAVREGDKIALMELHPGEYQQLKAVFRRNDDVAVHHRDGFEGVMSLLPPKPNRGLILIDPSYEVKTEYQQVAKFIIKAHQRWSNGCYMIWYPLLKAANHQAMLRKLRLSGIRKILKAEMCVKSDDDDRMYGTGLLVINPPWQLDEQLKRVSDILQTRLSAADAPEVVVEWLVKE